MNEMFKVSYYLVNVQQTYDVPVETGLYSLENLESVPTNEAKGMRDNVNRMSC